MAYSFPVLRNGEILQCLSELSIPMTEENLTKPNADHIRNVYEAFIEMLMGISREDLRQPLFAAIDFLEYPKLHDESIGELGFYRALMKLMMTVGVPDFSLKDVHKPEYPRTQRNLSAIINFAKFREEKLTKYQELTSQTEAYIDQKQHLEDEIRELDNELQEYRVQRAKDEPEVAALQQENDALAAEITALNKEQAALQNEIRGFKQTTQELGEKITNEKNLLLNARQDTAKLKSQIVQSPERLKRVLEDLSNTLESEKGTISDVEIRSRELQAKYDGLIKIEKDVAKCFKMMQECEDELKKAKAARKQCKDTEGTIGDQEKRLEGLATAEQHLRRQIGNLQEKLSRLQQHEDQKRDAAAKALEIARAERLAMEQGRVDVQASLDNNNKIIHQVEQKIAILTQQHNSEVTRLKQKYSELEHQVTEYHRVLFNAMDASV